MRASVRSGGYGNMASSFFTRNLQCLLRKNIKIIGGRLNVDVWICTDTDGRIHCWKVFWQVIRGCGPFLFFLELFAKITGSIMKKKH